MMNPILRRDVDNLRLDAFNRLRPNVHPTIINASIDLEIFALKETFKTYGVEYNEETVKAAIATTIWSAKATQDMFVQEIPEHIEQSPLSFAVHGQLVAMAVLFRAIDLEEENQE